MENDESVVRQNIDKSEDYMYDDDREQLLPKGVDADGEMPSPELDWVQNVPVAHDDTITVEQSFQQSDVARINKRVRWSVRNCSLSVVLTTLSELLTVAGVGIHLYGFTAPYWRREQFGGVHFGLWIYCNQTCYTIHSYNSWYYGVQACAVLGFIWSVISGILSIHALTKTNRRSYILSLFFFCWTCLCMAATVVMFVCKVLEGYALSLSFACYVIGGIFQLVAVAISIIDIGPQNVFNMIVCATRSRKTHKYRTVEESGHDNTSELG
ncbi:uncharacterized protein [Argopecten irradians]|uniref:uncharacterized protein isoform X1 n=1 Tax=Argopecten irradians TaxID=31199 RepID=UPI00371C31D7